MHVTQALIRQKDAELEARGNLLYKAKAQARPHLACRHACMHAWHIV